MLLLIALCASVCVAQGIVFQVPLFFSFGVPHPAWLTGGLQFVPEGFQSWQVDQVSNNPTITVARGSNVTLEMTTSGHVLAVHMSPFNVSTQDRYMSGVNVTSAGPVLWNVPLNAPDLLYYQCEVSACDPKRWWCAHPRVRFTSL
jgi:hypothetical protein